MRSRDLEPVIDDVARSMTAGAVPPVHARAMASLRPRRSPAWRTVAYLTSAAAVAALFVVAIQPSRGSSASIPAAVPTIASGAPSASEIAPPVGRSTTRPVAVARAVPSVSVASDFGIPALLPPAPLNAIADSPIQPEPLSIPQLTVMPMPELKPLAIPALGDIDRHQ